MIIKGNLIFETLRKETSTNSERIHKEFTLNNLFLVTEGGAIMILR